MVIALPLANRSLIYSPKNCDKHRRACALVTWHHFGCLVFRDLVAGFCIPAGAIGGGESFSGRAVSGGDLSAALPALCFVAKGVSDSHAQHAALWCRRVDTTRGTTRALCGVIHRFDWFYSAQQRYGA